MANRSHKNVPGSLPPDFDPDVPSREDILRVLREVGEPVEPEALAAMMGVEREATHVGFERRLAAMERDGQLMPNRKGVLLLASKLDFLAGKVQGHRDGFGFLIRDDRGPDLFLAPREMLKVLHGDRVLARPAGEFRGKPEGQIVEVTERANRKLVGRFLRERGLDLVVPEDQRIKHDVLIPPGESGRAEHGQVVSVEIIEQPTRHSQPMGRVVEVLGEIDDPGMEIEIAVRKFEVPHEFSDAAIKQASRLPDEVRRADLKGRVDLRDVPLLTIDGADARDFDDAVYCEPVELGTGARSRPGWRLLVAIADVSHYVKPGDALDDDAQERATSVYFPRRVIPMLPESLSNGLCSLNPEVDRLVLVCDMVIPANGAKAGTVTAYQFYPAVMHSHARTTYDQVWAALQDGEAPAPEAVRPAGKTAVLPPECLPHLRNLHSLFKVLLQQRHKRGAADYDTVETKILCNDLGRIERIVAHTRNDAHRLIEECMLAANTCAADFMTRSKHPGLFRVHQGPTDEKLIALRLFLRNLGLTLGGGDDPQASDYSKLVDSARDRPDFALIQSMCLRSMQQAVYSPDNVGHFGLAYPAYGHFTSPIRRYPDLLTHRVIKALVAGKRYVPDSDEPIVAGRRAADHEQAIWEKLGMMCSARERRADDASRDVEAWLKCWYVKERVGETFDGKVTGVAPFGIFVTLDELYVEGMVHVSELGTDYFQFTEGQHELRGERTGVRYRLTDAVRIQVARVDLEARRIEFRLDKGANAEPGRRSGGRRDGGGESVSARVSAGAADAAPFARRGDERKGEDRKSDDRSRLSRAIAAPTGRPGKPGKADKAAGGYKSGPKSSKPAVRRAPRGRH